MGFVSILKSPPIVFLSVVIGLATRWQDIKELTQLSVLVVLSREGSGCKLCDTLVLFTMKEAKINKLKGGIKCNTVCFGLGGKCKSTCNLLVGAMENSTEFPCQAAGLCPKLDIELGSANPCRWSYKAMGCLPAGGVCKHRLPTTCELAPGYKQWTRLRKFVTDDVQALGGAFVRPPKYCSDPDAGPSCIRDAVGIGRAAQFMGYALLFLVGTYATIRAIESPGGADDRQWLVFWLINMGFGFLERFADVLLSRLPRYYELKLVALIWLMFYGGAESLCECSTGFNTGFQRLVRPRLPACAFPPTRLIRPF